MRGRSAGGRAVEDRGPQRTQMEIATTCDLWPPVSRTWDTNRGSFRAGLQGLEITGDISSGPAPSSQPEVSPSHSGTSKGKQDKRGRAGSGDRDA